MPRDPIKANDSTITEATARLANMIAESQTSNQPIVDPPRKNCKPYIWESDGTFSRREDGVLITYTKGDKVEMTPYEAFHCRGSIKTLGGLLIPKSMFDGKDHPNIEAQPAMTPAERAAKAEVTEDRKTQQSGLRAEVGE